MEGWKEVKLKTLIKTMGDGGTPSTLDSANYGGDIPWVVVEDVEPEIFSTRDSLTEKGLSKCSAKMWEPETVILTTGATIGKVGVAKIPLCTKQGITGIVCNQFLHNYYLKYWLEANTNQLIRYSQGTTFKEIRTRSLGNLKIKVPKPYTKESISEQTAIAKILSTVDEAIRSTRETISKLERVKKSLMQNLLSGKMKPDGTLRPAAEFYEDEKMGLVPKGWMVKAIGEMFDSHPTASYSRSKLFEQGNCKYIHYGDIHTKFDRFLDVSNTELPYISNDMIKRFVFLQDGDLVIADTSEDYDGVGKLVEIKNPNETKVIAGLHTLMIRSKTDDLINGYKGYLFNEYRVRLSMLKYVTGIKVYSISKSCLAKVLVSVPPVNEQIEIKNKLDSVSKQIQNKQEKITSLESLKKSLMQQLLTGRVRVK